MAVVPARGPEASRAPDPVVCFAGGPGESVLPLGVHIPADLAPAAEEAFRRMAADCAADPGCHRAFPDPSADIRTVLARLGPPDGGPVQVAVEVDEEGRKETLRLSRAGAVLAIRYMLYSTDGVRRMPLVLRRAAGGDLGTLAQAAYDLAAATVASAPMGLYLSVTCAEGLDLESCRRSIRRPPFVTVLPE